MGLWRALRKWRYLVREQASLVVDDGKRTKFWRDMWCGDMSWEVAFPSVFCITSAKHAWVVICGT